MRYRVARVDGIEEHETIGALAKLCAAGDETFAPKTEAGDWWLVYADDVAVGFAGIRDATTEPEASFLCLAGVVPEHRGRGLQRRLIHARVQRARQLGKRAALSWVADWNVRSANNLVAAGFRLYWPAQRFGDKETVYFRKELHA